MTRTLKRLVTTAVLTLLLGAGASEGRVSPATDASVRPLLHEGDSIDVRLRSATTDMALLDDDARRIADKIHQHYGEAAAGAAPGARRYEVDIAIVNYSTGYDYIRAMTPYVGEVRVDAQVRILSLPEGREVGRYTMTQRFDPGQVTNAASRIGDIEEPFVQSVVETLRGVASTESPKRGV